MNCPYWYLHIIAQIQTPPVSPVSCASICEAWYGCAPFWCTILYTRVRDKLHNVLMIVMLLSWISTYARIISACSRIPRLWGHDRKRIRCYANSRSEMLNHMEDGPYTECRSKKAVPTYQRAALTSFLHNHRTAALSPSTSSLDKLSSADLIVLETILITSLRYSFVPQIGYFASYIICIPPSLLFILFKYGKLWIYPRL